MLHRLRLVCGEDMEVLYGTIEVDEVYVGGKERNKHESKKRKAERGGAGKTAILEIRERRGRVKAMPVSDTSKATLQGTVRQHVRPSSMICTDDNLFYCDVAHRHKTVNHSAKEYVSGMAYTNGIESVWAVLKRGYNGIYHNWSGKHCRQYVNEFVFRLNEGNCEVDTQDRLVPYSAGYLARRSHMRN